MVRGEWLDDQALEHVGDFVPGDGPRVEHGNACLRSVAARSPRSRSANRDRRPSRQRATDDRDAQVSREFVGPTVARRVRADASTRTSPQLGDADGPDDQDIGQVVRLHRTRQRHSRYPLQRPERRRGECTVRSTGPGARGHGGRRDNTADLRSARLDCATLTYLRPMAVYLGSMRAENPIRWEGIHVRSTFAWPIHRRSGRKCARDERTTCICGQGARPYWHSRCPFADRYFSRSGCGRQVQVLPIRWLRLAEEVPGRSAQHESHFR